ncbi:DUF254-domain-containing protein [Metschnikowia bicuspidata var. bicuspidata NRRL YB-4993]|uniref:Vacuolar fusion protein MON1 n=1 Tax=Metschnikowia bicuspidata var. bicuspidata NRRL YB-4993 TaxID=869754 RepID=A0A1A0HKA7_9ASCO|nr:DUF254-domain-containing protein [Metschnikowia bicuspidata var. bicuspidata NRRL YB-4993]OBA24455.1 DUF254-domain-containing protein [Metschnikowia bicuspidata var. bicuspidata NRRL YB-4993]
MHPEANLHAAGAITAVCLKSADQAEISTSELDHRPDELDPVTLNMPSLGSNFSTHFGSGVSSDDDSFSDQSNAAIQLPDLFNNLMSSTGHRRDKSYETFNNYNLLTEDDTCLDEEYLRLKVLVDKLNHEFKAKLKHFFILSAAGKPIYSLHGNDDVLLGYMGLITTIIASFQDGLKQEVTSVSLGLLRIVAKNKHPLILVAISKIPHEINSSAPSNKSILENQLEFLYSYMLAVLSRAVIVKKFESGMNYDLRRILTTQDFNALDTLAMKLTYGVHSTDENARIIDTSYSIGASLNSIRCVRISNTCRTKLSDILLSVKNLKVPKEDGDFVSTISNKLYMTEEITLVAADLLFGFITMEDRVVTHLRPRNHKLTSRDISTLLYIIGLNSESLTSGKDADLWIPLCMPEFNNSGFLHCYVKTFLLSSCDRPMTIILVSGNKNSFFNMKEAANYAVAKIKGKKLFSKRLGMELSLSNGKSTVLGELKISTIKHFIYKRKEYNQIFIDDITQETAFSNLSKFQYSSLIISLYSNLIISKGDENDMPRFKSKKLTYSRLHTEEDFITGILLTDQNYEFYCLCEGSVSSQIIIDESLRIIKWCDRYKRRLFVGEGICF